MLLMYLMKGTECSFNCFSDIILFMGSSGVSFFLSNLILRLILSDTLTSKSVVLSLLYSLLHGDRNYPFPLPRKLEEQPPQKRKPKLGKQKNTITEVPQMLRIALLPLFPLLLRLTYVVAVFFCSSTLFMSATSQNSQSSWIKATNLRGYIISG